MLPEGRSFYKLTGSGNDFVMFNLGDEEPGTLAEAGNIRRLCARGLGVGADGVVFLCSVDRADGSAAFRMRYHNSDGSLASLCGNAALCSTRLAVELGTAPASGFRFVTDAGVISARIAEGLPEIDLEPIADLLEDAQIDVRETEIRLGFAVAGVPHLVVQVPDVRAVDIDARGRALRHHPSLRDGANVNFVSRAGDGAWHMRTYERGVEGETLACGTGAVASAAVLRAWGASGERTAIRTRSGQTLHVSLPPLASARPSLRGEGRIVFTGRLGELG
jgi:diaminopimelate epimerase